MTRISIIRELNHNSLFTFLIGEQEGRKSIKTGGAEAMVDRRSRFDIVSKSLSKSRTIEEASESA